MTRVKICGITSLKDLETVTRLGADAVGVITGIPSSQRNVAIEKAKTLIENAPMFTKTILVIAPRSAEEAFEVCNYVNPDAVQIHGEALENGEYRKALPGFSIIKPVSVNESGETGRCFKAAHMFDAVLLDSSTGSKLGGTGKVHDWEISRQLALAIKPKPLILAGGLNPDNVADAIRRVRPYAVDVCTGTEKTPGVKDPKKVQRFLYEVNEADRRNIA